MPSKRVWVDDDWLPVYDIQTTEPPSDIRRWWVVELPSDLVERYEAAREAFEPVRRELQEAFEDGTR